MREKRLLFHVGIAKTGTKFLQHKIFPKVVNAHYIKSCHYKKCFKLIDTNLSKNILLSREFDRQLKDELLLFSKKNYDIQIIMVLRRHEEYIASQYRRFIKNGYRFEFEDFIDLKDNQGFFKQEHLLFYDQIKFIEKTFGKPPIVLNYDTLKNSPDVFLSNLLNKTGLVLESDKISFKRRHSSYDENQLIFIKRVCRFINLRKRRIFDNSVCHFCHNLINAGLRYGLLFIGSLTKANSSLIDDEQLNKIRDFYKDDWEKAMQYTQQ